VQGQRLRESINVPEDADEVSYTFLAVRQSLTYTVQGGDYTTRVYRIDVPTSVRLSLVRSTITTPPTPASPRRPASEPAAILKRCVHTSRTDLCPRFIQSIKEP